MKKVVLILSLIAIVFVSNAQTPDKNSNDVLLSVIADNSEVGQLTLAVLEESEPLTFDVETISFTNESGEALFMFRKLWEPQGDGTYTYYYKEYEEVYCGLGCGVITVATGRCKSTSGTIYQCTSGM